MPRHIKKLLARNILLGLTIGYSVLVTLLFLMPGRDVPKVHIPYIDKVAHVVLFCLLSALWLLALLYKSDNRWVKILPISIVILVYGIIIEVIQAYFIESRNADEWDLAANTLGILLGLLLFNILRKRWTLKS